MADRYPLVYNPSANQLQELQTGDSLNLGGSTLSNTVFSGIITATAFSGSGAGLTGVTANETSTLDNILTRGSSSSQAMSVGSFTADSVTSNGSISAVSATFSGNVSIAGTLTYEDVINVDSVGIATARVGLKVLAGGINVTGVSTFNDNVVLGDSDNLYFGADNDLQISHDGANSTILNTTGELIVRDDTRIRVRTDQFVLNSGDNAENILYAAKDAGVELYFDGDKKLETYAGGIKVGTGITMHGLNGNIGAAGSVTAYEFYGDGSNLTGVAAAGSGGGALDITSCLFI